LSEQPIKMFKTSILSRPFMKHAVPHLNLVLSSLYCIS
jgi:hypothetical protein